MKCAVEDCDDQATERHHVIYDPQPVVKMLCAAHHLELTAINTHQVKAQKHALSNKQRWKIWYLFIKGERHGRITRADEDWRLTSQPFLLNKVVVS